MIYTSMCASSKIGRLTLVWSTGAYAGSLPAFFHSVERKYRASRWAMNHYKFRVYEILDDNYTPEM